MLYRFVKHSYYKKKHSYCKKLWFAPLIPHGIKTKTLKRLILVGMSTKFVLELGMQSAIRIPHPLISCAYPDGWCPSVFCLGEPQLRTPGWKDPPLSPGRHLKGWSRAPPCSSHHFSAGFICIQAGEPQQSKKFKCTFETLCSLFSRPWAIRRAEPFPLTRTSALPS